MAKRPQASNDAIREACEADLWTFACTMLPDRYFGDVHKDLMHFFQHNEHDYLLGMIPRDHQKSVVIAVYVAWRLTVNVNYTFLYVSSNPGLSEEQLLFIKGILYSKQHRALWPQHLNFVKDQRGDMAHKPKGRWRNDMIELDHPDKKGGRDPNVRAVSAGSTITGYHVHEIIFDDLVTDENYESEALRRDVSKCFMNCAKIASTGAKMKAVGTRYGQNDEYSKWLEMEVPEFNEHGEETGTKRLWDIFERVVEDSSNRTGDGNFLWPKMEVPNVGTFGMDQAELAKKKAMLTYNGDLTGFYAQFYNDPNDDSMLRITRDCFQYIEQKHLTYSNGVWYYGQKALRLTVAADLAFTASKNLKRGRRDYTAICVLGRDSDGYLYVLDLDRFQTDKLEVYYNRILELQEQWQFREIFVETNHGGQLVKTYIEDMVRKTGGSLTVQGVAHTSHGGKKEERIMQAVEPRYRNKEVYHVRRGLTKHLEEELMLPRPKNDDLKDVLALCIEKSKPVLGKGLKQTHNRSNVVQLSRFGGVRRRA